ncbi:MAG TPA: RNA polymerase sigma factor [Vicinamibacterales bacterium]|nr:RNA polymerase sigma factor [Vicinamibacterales bacterium]
MQMVSGAVLERWDALSDEQVVALVLEGQTALFEVLMRRHNERIYRAARAILRDERESEDVMQQAYVNAYAHLRQFDRRAQFSTWLTRIAVNEAISRARKRGRYQSLDEDAPGASETSMSTQQPPDPERQAFTRELSTLLEAAVDTLPDGHREVFVLRDVEGLSTADAAESLGVSVDVVKTRLSRARAALRRQLFERAGMAASNAFSFQRPRCDRVVAAVMARIGG